MPQHMVIGHSQVRNLESYRFPDSPDIDFDLTVKCVRGGKAFKMAQMIKKEVVEAKVPLRISAIIWQNSIWNITISEVENIVDDMETFLKVHPFHRVAFPECLFVPEQEHLWDKVHHVNLILKSYNERQGYDRYSLFKIAQQYSKAKGMYTVRQTSYREFNRAEDDGKDGSGLGYYLDEGPPKRRYAKHIRKFHKYGFSPKKKVEIPLANIKERGASGSSLYQPQGKMLKAFPELKKALPDARDIITKMRLNRGVSPPSQSNVVVIPKTSGAAGDGAEVSVESLEGNTDYTAPEDDDYTPQDDQEEHMKEDMIAWISYGAVSGYLMQMVRMLRSSTGAQWAEYLANNCARYEEPIPGDRGETWKMVEKEFDDRSLRPNKKRRRLSDEKDRN